MIFNFILIGIISVYEHILWVERCPFEIRNVVRGNDSVGRRVPQDDEIHMDGKTAGRIDRISRESRSHQKTSSRIVRP